MCQSEPTTYGVPLSIADDLGHDVAPAYCRAEMTGKNIAEGHQEYTCAGCRTVVEVDDLGLVFDIRTL